MLSRSPFPFSSLFPFSRFVCQQLIRLSFEQSVTHQVRSHIQPADALLLVLVLLVLLSFPTAVRQFDRRFVRDDRTSLRKRPVETSMSQCRGENSNRSFDVRTNVATHLSGGRFAVENLREHRTVETTIERTVSDGRRGRKRKGDRLFDLDVTVNPRVNYALIIKSLLIRADRMSENISKFIIVVSILVSLRY